MKTGRLLKFSRPGAEIHAYLYKDGAQFRASVYVSVGGKDSRTPRATLDSATEPRLAEDVRAWVDENYPRGR